MQNVLNDEPSTADKLSRRLLARTFSDLATQCQTPLVIGVYGAWGSGKTTFLRLIESEFDVSRSVPVWFNAWQHDQDAAPAVSLLHAMIDALGMRNEFENLLAQVALAFGSVLMQKTTTLNLDNLQNIQALLDQEGFRVRDARSKLHSYLTDVIARARAMGKERVIFFVDDLDKCSPSTVLRVLEAIKLYFNLDGCVFFLGIDHASIESALAKTTAIPGDSQVQYLDKLIQLPFSLPPLSEFAFKSYLSSLVPAELSSCLPLLLAGLERNPRSAKRFINDLILRHRFGTKLNIPNYDPRLLTLLLFFEHLQPAVFKALGEKPGLLLKLRENADFASEEIKSKRLIDVLYSGYVPQFAPIGSYVALTSLSVAVEPSSTQPLDIDKILFEHRCWLRSFGKSGRRASLIGARLEARDFKRLMLRDAGFEAAILSNADFSGADLRRANLAGAQMVGVNLTDAYFRFSDLREADLRQANLCNADLRGADLRRTNLRGVDLTRTCGLTSQQIDESITDMHTQLPPHLRYTFAKSTI
jgi:hypothetical protein